MQGHGSSINAIPNQQSPLAANKWTIHPSRLPADSKYNWIFFWCKYHGCPLIRASEDNCNGWFWKINKKVVLGFFFCVLFPWAQSINGGALTDSKYVLTADFVHFVQLFIKRCRACEVFHHFWWNTKATDPLFYWDPKWCFKHLFSFWFAVDVTEVWFWSMLRGSPLLSLPYSLSLCERWFNLQLGSTSRLRAPLVQPTSSNQLGSPALIQPFSDHHRVFVKFQIRFADSRVSCSIWLYQVWKWWDGKSAVGYVHIFPLLCVLFSVITAHLSFMSFLVMQIKRPTWLWYFPELGGLVSFFLYNKII